MSITIRPVHLALGLISFLETVQAISFPVCKKAFEDLIAQNQTTINGKLIFLEIQNTIDNGSITYDACRAVCDAGDSSIVSDCGPRLSSWVLPVVILAGTVQQPPLAFGQRVWAILRMAGDPIGSLIWMIQELRLYQHCLDEGTETAVVLKRHLYSNGIADKKKDQDLAVNFARIFHALSKAKPGRDPTEISRYFQKAIAKMADLEPSKKILAGFRNQVNKSGRVIVEHKSRSTPKSCFAVFGFLVPLIIAIVPEVSPPASGGMVASILTLSPLLFMVFLSNAIGEYSNLNFLNQELGNVRASIPKQVRQKLKDPLSVIVHQKSTTAFQYMRRPMKRRPIPLGLPGEPLLLRLAKRHWLDGILALVIFVLAIASAGGAIGTAPTFFHERHIVLIVMFSAWVGSWGITYWARDEHRAERLVAAVHCMVAILVPVFLAGMTCGWLSNCKSLTGYFWYGAEKARMPLDLRDVFVKNVTVVYPALVTVCLGVNLVAFGVVRYLIFPVPFHIIAGNDSKIGAGEDGLEADGEVELADLSETP